MEKLTSKELHAKYSCVPLEVELYDEDALLQELDVHIDDEFQDDDATVFMERSLLYVLSRTNDTKQQELKSSRLFPVSREVDPGATSFSIQKYTMYGQAKAFADYANDLPRADVYGEEEIAQVVGFGTSYGWSVDEIRRAALAAKTGRNPRLNERRAMSARRAADEIVDYTAWYGNKKKKIPGFINYPGITMAVNPLGVSGETEFEDKTPDEIIATFSALFNAVVVPTKGREAPNTIILPLEKFNYLRHTRLTDTGVSLLSYLRDNFPEITMIEWVEELSEQGVDGSDRMMIYRRDPMNLELHMPLPFTTYAAQVKAMEWIVPCEVKTGGVRVYYPLSVAYMDGI